MKLINRFIRETEGQDLIEYALLAGAISLAAIGAMQALGGALSSKYTELSTTVSAAS